MDKFIEVPISTTTIKKFNGNDLPLYFKWNVEHTEWLYRVRVKDGRTIADMLQKTSDGVEFKYVTLSTAFSETNVPISADDWRNMMHQLIQEAR